MRAPRLDVGKIEFHGRVPRGSASTASPCFIFDPDGLQGVRGGVGVSSEATQRAGRHGEHDAPVFKAARIVTVAGDALARNAAQLEQLGIVLGGLGADGESLPLVYYSPGGRMLYGAGRVIAQEFDQHRAGATYSLSVRMADPLWYAPADESVSQGDSVTFGNVAIASHEGNTAAHPRFTVSPLAGFNLTAGYQIKGKGRTFEVPGPLNQGQVDKVDFERGTVHRDGVLVLGVIPRTFAIAGGEQVEWRLWPLSGAGKAVMQHRSTFF